MVYDAIVRSKAVVTSAKPVEFEADKEDAVQINHTLCARKGFAGALDALHRCEGAVERTASVQYDVGGFPDIDALRHSARLSAKIATLTCFSWWAQV